MNIRYWELRYASTQFNLLTGTDGFGIRTYTQDMPEELIDRLKNRNLFYYDSGNKMLCGVHDLMNNPAIVEDYPLTYAIFREKLGDKSWIVLSRTAFIGRDYGWYLNPPDTSARSGNTFTHAIFIQDDQSLAIQDRQLLNYFIPRFLPRMYRNDSANPELRALLTNENGKPEILPVQTIETAEIPVESKLSNNQNFIKTLFVLYQALMKEQKVVVVLNNKQTEDFITALLSCLPQFFCQKLNILTNYQGFNLDTEFNLLFINEYYPRSIDSGIPNLLLCNCQTGEFPPVSDSDFFRYFNELLTKDDTAGIQTMLSGLHGIIEEFKPGMALDQLFYAWWFLIANFPTRFNFQPEAVLRYLNQFPLRHSFRSQINQHINRQFVQAISQGNHQKVAATLELVNNLDFESTALKEIKTLFTDYCLEADHATQLMRYQSTPELILNNLRYEDRADDLDKFIQNNKAMSVEGMDYFLLKFCLNFPEKTEDYLNWRLLDGGPGNDFGIQLLKNLGEEAFFDLLIQHDFFIYLGAENQQKLFVPAIRECIKKFYSADKEPLDKIRSVQDKPKIAFQLLDYLTEITIENPKDYFTLIMLLDAYQVFYEDIHFTGTQLKSINHLVYLLLKSAESSTLADLESLPECLESIDKKLKKEQKEILGGPSTMNTSLLSQIKFILQVLSAGKDYTYLASRVVLSQEEHTHFFDIYLRFLLAVSGTDVWSDKSKSDIYIKSLVKIFAFNKEDQENRFLLTDGGKGGLLDFIPQYSTRLIQKKALSEQEHEEKLITFYLNYTYALWKNREIKDSEDIVKKYFKLGVLLKKITNYLNFLNDTNSNICYAVVQIILKDDSPDTIDLRQHIEANVQVRTVVGGIISNMFKTFSSPFKKNDN